jgi:hypothetical protein
VLPREESAEVEVEEVALGTRRRGGRTAASPPLRPAAPEGAPRWPCVAWILAQSACNAAHWDKPVKTDPPARRWLIAEIHRLRPLYDEDGAVSCLSPPHQRSLGRWCKQPGLIWDDSPDWLAVITPRRGYLVGRGHVTVMIPFVEANAPNLQRLGVGHLNFTNPSNGSFTPRMP